MIKVSVVELKDNIQKLSSALSDFSGYSNGFINKSKNSLGSCNSDFTDKAQDVLSNMADTKAPDLYNDLVKFCKIASMYVWEFEKQDNQISNNLEGKR